MENNRQPSPKVWVQSDLRDEVQTFAISELKKLIKVGDFMSVESGVHSGSTGTVLGIYEDLVTLMLGGLVEHEQVWGCNVDRGLY